MRLTVNLDLNIISDVIGSSQQIQSVRIPRGNNEPISVVFSKDAKVYDPEPADVYVPNETERFRLRQITTSIVGTSEAYNSVVTTTEPHNLKTGDTVIIAGNNSVPSSNGQHVVTVINATQFSIQLEVTTAGTGGTVTKPAGATNGKYVWQEDNKRRYLVIDDTQLGNNSGYQIQPRMQIKWLVKELKKFDGPLLTVCDAFERVSSQEPTYVGKVNYITTYIDTLLGVNPPDVANDQEEASCMAQLMWDGPLIGKTHWINHIIRNTLDRDGDIQPATTAMQSGKTLIPVGADSVTVLFAQPYVTSSWHFVGQPLVSNTVDSNPISIMPKNLVSRTNQGFVFTLTSEVPTPNYTLEWIVALD